MIAVVIPTYCEAENIEKLVSELESLNLDLWLIVVDDSSPDGTASVVRGLMRRYDNLTLVERPRKGGIGTAILRGFKVSSSSRKEVDYVAVMDADLSHDPKELPKLIEGLKDSDVVVGSRYVEGGSVEGWSLSRKAISGVANFLARKILGLKVKDATSGYRVYRLNAVVKVIGEVENLGFPFQVEVLYRLVKRGFRVREVPIRFVDRRRGRSKLNLWEILSFIYTLLKLKFGKNTIKSC
ncbi:polyprenol monophosphomannose synthase [Candidatus Bathyarchaeota archaeon]|nr:polyprenol monophosphomannose synthase [Candidatus Bathyarchaeota archaeon]